MQLQWEMVEFYYASSNFSLRLFFLSSFSYFCVNWKRFPHLATHLLVGQTNSNMVVHNQSPNRLFDWDRGRSSRSACGHSHSRPHHIVNRRPDHIWFPSSFTNSLSSLAELPHPIYWCFFYIVLNFGSTVVGFLYTYLNQCKIFQNATQRNAENASANRMCKVALDCLFSSLCYKTCIA